MIHPRHPDFRNTPASASRPYGRFRPVDPAASPVVSVITPWFNVGAAFHETAESLFRQTLQQWEWLIVNDGSTDPQALGELETYRRSDDERIRVIDMAANSGPAAARNRGVAEARASLVFHLDADDLIEPTMIEKCYWFLLTHPDCPWVNGWSVAFGADRYLWRKGFDEGGRFLADNWVTGRAMIRAAAHERIGGYDEDIRGGYEDWAFWLKGAERGLWGVTLQEFFDWYRQRENHWSRWEDLAEPKRRESFRKALRARFGKLRAGSFPRARDEELGAESVPAPCANQLRPDAPSVVFVLPDSPPLAPDLEVFLGDVLRELSGEGIRAILVDPSRSSHAAMEALSTLTPQAYRLHAFLPEAHFLAYFSYLLDSRHPDVVVWLGKPPEKARRLGDGEACGCAQFILESDPSRNSSAPDGLGQLLLRAVSGGKARGDQGVLRPGIDADRWARENGIRRRVRKMIGWSPHTPVLLLPVMCAEASITALHELFLSGRACRFLFYGPEAARSAALPHLGDKGRSCSARFFTVESLDHVRDLLCVGDLLFVPVWSGADDPSPVLAAAMGLPVLAPAAGAPEWLPGKAFHALKPGESAGAMAASLVRSLAPLLDDPDRLRQPGRIARERVRQQFPAKPALDQFLARIRPPN
ncbi:MAG: glycosyltransferase [Opitutales bacterium]|nr:glycosyltransferase [Opitutales bacterium]